MKHHSLVVDFSNLDFEKIDTEILADEAKEQEEIEADVVLERILLGRTLLEEKMLTNLLYPFVVHTHLFSFFWKTMVAPLFWGFYFWTSFYFLEHLLPPSFEAFA